MLTDKQKLSPAAVGCTRAQSGGEPHNCYIRVSQSQRVEYNHSVSHNEFIPLHMSQAFQTGISASDSNLLWQPKLMTTGADIGPM